jgi:murein DD-endopeptidase MepM/ murein hydrolase activator NlpD
MYLPGVQKRTPRFREAKIRIPFQGAGHNFKELFMNNLHLFLKKAFTPVTIMVIPHSSLGSLNLKVPVVGILFILLCTAIGASYVFSLASYGWQYPSLVQQVDYYARQFSQWSSTASAVKEAEKEFHRIFSIKSKDKIFEKLDSPPAGSIDIETLAHELKTSAESAEAIRKYLRAEKVLYFATPKGLPVPGNITSRYGTREDPFDQTSAFHSGIDISAPWGTPVRATADGVVAFSGRNGGSGIVVVLEHGFGLSTVYAHTSKNAVKTEQRVKRGEIIAYVGSTGKSTGPHLHYEVWRKHKSINPQKYIKGDA